MSVQGRLRGWAAAGGHRACSGVDAGRSLPGRYPKVVNGNKRAPTPIPLPPPTSIDRLTALAFVYDRSLPFPRPLGATRRAHHRGPRGRSYPRHLLLRPAAPPRPTARPRSDTAVVGRVADTARSLCAPGPHRAVALSTAVTPGRRARTLSQHREPRVTTARRPEAHLPQRLRGATLEGQGATHLRADRAGLQRPAAAEEGPPQRRCCGSPGLARRRPVAALSAPATAGERMVATDATGAADATGGAHAADATRPPECRR
jgi:hypothetical protein